MTSDTIHTIHYVTRDLGSGIEEGFAHGRFTGEPDSSGAGKFTFEPIDGPTLYLFADEIVNMEPATIEAIQQAAFMAGYRKAKEQVLEAL